MLEALSEDAAQSGFDKGRKAGCGFVAAKNGVGRIGFGERDDDEEEGGLCV